MGEIYVLTKAGRRAYRDSSLSGEELRVIEYIHENRSASEDQLEVVGGERWVLRRLKRGGLIKELV